MVQEVMPKVTIDHFEPFILGFRFLKLLTSSLDGSTVVLHVDLDILGPALPSSHAVLFLSTNGFGGARWIERHDRLHSRRRLNREFELLDFDAVRCVAYKDTLGSNEGITRSCQGAERQFNGCSILINYSNRCFCAIDIHRIAISNTTEPLCSSFESRRRNNRRKGICQCQIVLDVAFFQHRHAVDLWKESSPGSAFFLGHCLDQKGYRRGWILGAWRFFEGVSDVDALRLFVYRRRFRAASTGTVGGSGRSSSGWFGCGFDGFWFVVVRRIHVHRYGILFFHWRFW
mmetsp:Transcript_13086/g.27100  ORF Transcript_13086/g.27100 Transcript_13086/m.27100 type:complete len:287 (-) Transcript_13086:343-1203(-)